MSPNEVPANYPARAERPGFEVGDRRQPPKNLAAALLKCLCTNRRPVAPWKWSTTGTPALTGDARQLSPMNGPTPRRTMTTWKYRSWRRRGVGITQATIVLAVMLGCISSYFPRHPFCRSHTIMQQMPAPLSTWEAGLLGLFQGTPTAVQAVGSFLGRLRKRKVRRVEPLADVWPRWEEGKPYHGSMSCRRSQRGASSKYQLRQQVCTLWMVHITRLAC